MCRWCCWRFDSERGWREIWQIYLPKIVALKLELELSFLAQVSGCLSVEFDSGSIDLVGSDEEP